jgi:hypothetical protein
VWVLTLVIDIVTTLVAESVIERICRLFKRTKRPADNGEPKASPRSRDRRD